MKFTSLRKASPSPLPPKTNISFQTNALNTNLGKENVAPEMPSTFGWTFIYLENIVYHNFRQLWLVLGVKLIEINSNLFSR